ncbi:hypothetical protein TW95_gp1205 [Pandoravirus inopinatum]|uniref:Uncharacterized protein n=1 Tax=Pandoravirus inopinatum TaxID=1605721 RepID=A0A0B5J2X6_9VIRU|nr:hypothetical protein TW95_gp1205 [Pandoravirus inopinatum]AJF97939.1 hypothetical protein [Pandoravirus inopinatum]
MLQVFESALAKEGRSPDRNPSARVQFWLWARSASLARQPAVSPPREASAGSTTIPVKGKERRQTHTAHQGLCRGVLFPRGHRCCLCGNRQKAGIPPAPCRALGEKGKEKHTYYYYAHNTMRRWLKRLLGVRRRRRPTKSYETLSSPYPPLLAELDALVQRPVRLCDRETRTVEFYVERWSARLRATAWTCARAPLAWLRRPTTTRWCSRAARTPAARGW